MCSKDLEFLGHYGAATELSRHYSGCHRITGSTATAAFKQIVIIPTFPNISPTIELDYGLKDMFANEFHESGTGSELSGCSIQQ